MGYKIASALLLISIAALSLYMANRTPSVSSGDSELDLNCGFTEDFSKFLKDNGIFLLKEAMAAGIFRGMISNAQPLEERQALQIRLLKSLLSSFTATVTLALVEEKQMAMNLSRLASENWQPTSAHRAIAKPNCTRPLGELQR